MMKQITELENLLGHKVEFLLNQDGDRVIIKSGGDIPPEQDKFFKEFNTRSQAKRWLIQTIKKLKSEKDD